MVEVNCLPFGTVNEPIAPGVLWLAAAPRRRAKREKGWVSRKGGRGGSEREGRHGFCCFVCCVATSKLLVKVANNGNACCLLPRRGFVSPSLVLTMVKQNVMP